MVLIDAELGQRPKAPAKLQRRAKPRTPRAASTPETDLPDRIAAIVREAEHKGAMLRCDPNEPASATPLHGR